MTATALCMSLSQATIPYTLWISGSTLQHGYSPSKNHIDWCVYCARREPGCLLSCLCSCGRCLRRCVSASCTAETPKQTLSILLLTTSHKLSVHHA